MPRGGSRHARRHAPRGVASWTPNARHSPRLEGWTANANAGGDEASSFETGDSSEGEEAEEEGSRSSPGSRDDPRNATSHSSAHPTLKCACGGRSAAPVAESWRWWSWPPANGAPPSVLHAYRRSIETRGADANKFVEEEDAGDDDAGDDDDSEVARSKSPPRRRLCLAPPPPLSHRAHLEVRGAHARSPRSREVDLERVRANRAAEEFAAAGFVRERLVAGYAARRSCPPLEFVVPENTGTPSFREKTPSHPSGIEHRVPEPALALDPDLPPKQRARDVPRRERRRGIARVDARVAAAAPPRPRRGDVRRLTPPPLSSAPRGGGVHRDASSRATDASAGSSAGENAPETPRSVASQSTYVFSGGRGEDDEGRPFLLFSMAVADPGGGSDVACRATTVSPASATSFAAKTVREDDSWGSVARTFDARQSIVAANAGGASATASDQGASARRARAHATGSEEAGRRVSRVSLLIGILEVEVEPERRRVPNANRPAAAAFATRSASGSDSVATRVGEARGVRGDAPRVPPRTPEPARRTRRRVAGGSRVARRRRVAAASAARAAASAGARNAAFPRRHRARGESCTSKTASPTKRTVRARGKGVRRSFFEARAAEPSGLFWGVASELSRPKSNAPRAASSATASANRSRASPRSRPQGRDARASSTETKTSAASASASASTPRPSLGTPLFREAPGFHATRDAAATW